MKDRLHLRYHRVMPIVVTSPRQLPIQVKAIRPNSPRFSCQYAGESPISPIAQGEQVWLLRGIGGDPGPTGYAQFFASHAGREVIVEAADFEASPTFTR